METWIKLYRKFDEWEWFCIPEMVSLFIYLLLNANNSDNEWKGIKVKRGQLITGRKTLKEKTGISEQTLRTCLSRLEKTKELTIKSTNKYSIITICNYELYQNGKNGSNQLTNQQLTNNQPATNQQLTTIEEYKDIKNDNINNWRNDFNVYLAECKKGYEDYWNDVDLLKTQQRLNPGINIKLSIEKGYVNFWSTEAGWKFKKGKKAKDINWKSTITNSISVNKVYYTKQELATL
jgi:hypothetical protein